MTTVELHLELDLYLQKINSHYNKNILPQEKDVFINKGISSYINTRMNPRSNVKGIGFDNTVKRLEDLNPLVVTRRLKPIYKDNKIFYNLPLDYRGYINSSIKVQCIKSAIAYNKDSYFYYNLDSLDKTFKEQYFKLIIAHGDKQYVLFNSDTVPNGAISNEDVYTLPTTFLINNTLDVMLQKSLKLLKATYLDDKLIQDLELKYDKIAKVFKFKSDIRFSVAVSKGMQRERSEDAKEEIFTTLKGSSVLFREGNLVERDYLRQILNNSLMGNNTQSLICNRDRDSIYLYRDNKSKYYPIEIELTYIKQPTKVSAILDSNSELSDETLIEVIANVDRNIKGVLSMDSYDKTINENILIE